MKIEIPTPKFELGQQVFVGHTGSHVTHKPCADCEGEKVTRTKSGKETACPTCHGSGTSHKLADIKKFRECAGTLTITGVTIEVNEDGRTFYGGTPITYRGTMQWAGKPKQWNIFAESVCFATIQELAEWIAQPAELTDWEKHCLEAAK